MSDFENELLARLFEEQDEKYRDFQCRLMPGVEPESVIGVRTPILRRLAKEFSRKEGAAEFMASLPHRYYEENNMHGFLIETIGDYKKTVDEIDRFLPYINNWATCDLISPKVFAKHTDELYTEIKRWLKSDLVYTVRFGLEMLMSFYLDKNFKPKYLEAAAGSFPEEYYVDMMVAWFFATALAKQYDFALPYIENRRLSKSIHNKAIQKAIESYRITDSQKSYLRTLKIK